MKQIENFIFDEKSFRKLQRVFRKHFQAYFWYLKIIFGNICRSAKNDFMHFLCYHYTKKHNFLWIFKLLNSRKLKESSTVLPAETRLTFYRRLREQDWLAASWPKPRKWRMKSMLQTLYLQPQQANFLNVRDVPRKWFENVKNRKNLRNQKKKRLSLGFLEKQLLSCKTVEIQNNVSKINFSKNDWTLNLNVKQALRIFNADSKCF